jgi:hypothetical protein
MNKDEIRDYMRELGRKSRSNMTPEERSAAASNAARTRMEHLSATGRKSATEKARQTVLANRRAKKQAAMLNITNIKTFGL